MRKVINVKPLDNYKLELLFENSDSYFIMDMSPYIEKGISLDLKNKDFFNQVSIESGGGITWPNGYDFCPNYLYGLLNGVTN